MYELWYSQCMSLKIVYRVEGPDGVGPYRSNILPDEMYWLGRWERGTVHHHPTPEEDGFGLGLPFENERCGFASLDQARDWFGVEGLAFLYKNGFFLYGYSVPGESVRYGRTQVLFDPALAVQRVRVVRWSV